MKQDVDHNAKEAVPLWCETGRGVEGFPRPNRAHPVDLARMKIVVTGTPKTGNTWIRHLLASLYDLPMVDLQPDWRANDWAAFGPRWIGQQHFHAQRELREWAVAEDVVFVTPVRHPGDVLISLRHHLQNEGSSALTDPFHSMLLDPPDTFGEHTRRFVETGYFLLLHVSLQWLRHGWAYGVRYEDLWCDPVAALGALADAIHPLPVRRLKHALCACEADLMRSTYASDRNFVRKGGLGSWVEVLPAEIRELLAEREPYPAQFRALNYSMDPRDPSNRRRAEPASVQHALSRRTAFSNGVPLAPILIRAYFDLPEELQNRWPDPTVVEGDSFFAWLGRPAAADPAAGRIAPVVTELAWYLRSLRPDVAAAFPDPFGADRREFAHWFLYNAVPEYRFDSRFTLPVVGSWAEGDLALA